MAGHKRAAVASESFRGKRRLRQIIPCNDSSQRLLLLLLLLLLRSCTTVAKDDDDDDGGGSACETNRPSLSPSSPSRT